LCNFIRNHQGIAPVHQAQHILRLNVGFLIGQTVGYSRDFFFESPKLKLQPDLDLNAFAGSARITRTAQGLLIRSKMHATILAECVRCLTPFQLPLDAEFTELYAFNHKTVTESGLILPENSQLDLAPLTREYMLLEIPISPTCDPSCKGLCPYCGENLNEVTCDHTAESLDPRLTILKSLLDQGH